MKLKYGNILFVLSGRYWRTLDLTWKVSRFVSRISQNDIVRDVEAALNVWSKVVKLNFVRVKEDEQATLAFQFVPRSHGDGFDFDGPGGILAHAYYPYSVSYSGHIHFENSETWTSTDPNCEPGNTSNIFII